MQSLSPGSALLSRAVATAMMIGGITFAEPIHRHVVTKPPDFNHADVALLTCLLPCVVLQPASDDSRFSNGGGHREGELLLALGGGCEYRQQLEAVYIGHGTASLLPMSVPVRSRLKLTR